MLGTATCLVMYEAKINRLASSIALVPAFMTLISYVACVTVFAAIVNASGSRGELGALCQHLGTAWGNLYQRRSSDWIDKLEQTMA